MHAMSSCFVKALSVRTPERDMRHTTQRKRPFGTQWLCMALLTTYH